MTLKKYIILQGNVSTLNIKWNCPSSYFDLHRLKNLRRTRGHNAHPSNLSPAVLLQKKNYKIFYPIPTKNFDFILQPNISPTGSWPSQTWIQVFNWPYPLGKGMTFIWSILKSLYPRILCTKLGWKWLCGSREEVEKVYSLQMDRWTTNNRWSGKLTWV